jgi:cyclic beta-1,2-glucan synthetase
MRTVRLALRHPGSTLALGEVEGDLQLWVPVTDALPARRPEPAAAF